MKDKMTVHPAKMPATPSPATALKFPRFSGLMSGTEKWEKVARWDLPASYQDGTRRSNCADQGTQLEEEDGGQETPFCLCGCIRVS